MTDNNRRTLSVLLVDVRPSDDAGESSHLKPPAESRLSRQKTSRSCLGAVAGFAMLSMAGCILRPGMNSDCAWPPEPARTLNLASRTDYRHLVADAELLEELVDRYRFHPPDEQRQCERRLVDAVAILHSVDVSDVLRAVRDTPKRGMNLPVIVPVLACFLWTVLYVLRRIERRFGEEPWPLAITLIAASVVMSGVFIWLGELWTATVQMIRVGSQHVGGRVNRLMWLQHERQIFIVGVVLFWAMVLLRMLAGRRKALRPPRGDVLRM
jgi:hypothetical protein